MNPAENDDLKTAIDLKEFLHLRKEDLKSETVDNNSIDIVGEDGDKKISDESENKLIEELFENFSIEDGKASEEDKKLVDELLDDSLRNAEYNTFDDISKASPLIFLSLIRKLKRVLAVQEIEKLKKIIDEQKKKAFEKEFAKKLKMLMEQCFILWISMSPVFDRKRKLELLSRSFASSPDVFAIKHKIVKDLRNGQIKEKNILDLQVKIIETVKDIGLKVDKYKSNNTQKEEIIQSNRQPENHKEHINSNFAKIHTVHSEKNAEQKINTTKFIDRLQPQKEKPKFVDLIKEPRVEQSKDNIMVRTKESEMPDPRKTPVSKS